MNVFELNADSPKTQPAAKPHSQPPSDGSIRRRAWPFSAAKNESSNPKQPWAHENAAFESAPASSSFVT